MEQEVEGLHREESYRHSLHAHHHNLQVLHAKIENLHDALTAGHSHEELRETSHKLCQDMVDVQKHYLQGPHHASHWRNPGDHHKKHRFEEHTIVSIQTSTDFEKHDYDGGYDPALHHEHGMLSTSERGQYDERVREQNRRKEEDKRKRAEERSKSSAKEEDSAYEAEQFEEEEVMMLGPQAGATAQPLASPRRMAREMVKSLQGKVALQIGVSGYVSVVREGKAPRAWRICAGEVNP